MHWLRNIVRVAWSRRETSWRFALLGAAIFTAVQVVGHLHHEMWRDELHCWAVARNARGEYGLWQRRYWEHTIADEADFRHHADYIHYNPVKHGWVKQAADWPYSSFHRYVEQGTLPPNWAGGDDIGEYGE